MNKQIETHLKSDIFKKIAQLSAQLQVETYLVGGFVRDIFLDRPCKDIDILVLGSGIDFALKLAQSLPNKPKVNYFKNFGTAMMSIDGIEIEFVGARKESYQTHSRKPIVENGTLDDDLRRRDFTINALAIGLFPNFGQLIDQFEGQKHLDERKIITPTDPNTTFIDDPLRMMRAIRFATQLGFDIDTQTQKSIADNAHRIKIVSKERITDELNKIIASKIPSIGFRYLMDCGLLKFIFPEMQNLKGIKIIDNKGHKDNFYHTLQVLDNICLHTTDLWLRWAAILHDIAKPATQRFEENIGWTFHGHEDLGSRWVPKIFAHLKLPLDDKMRFVQKMVRLHLRPIALTKTEVTDSAVRRLLFEAGEDIEALMTLCRADITSNNESKVVRYLKNFDELQQKCKEIEEKDQLKNWQPPISGELIMETFGISPSKQVGTIKDAIREAILDGVIPNDYQNAYDMMIEMGKELGLENKIKNQRP